METIRHGGEQGAIDKGAAHRDLRQSSKSDLGRGLPFKNEMIKSFPVEI
jgi:hypothetical protein